MKSIRVLQAIGLPYVILCAGCGGGGGSSASITSSDQGGNSTGMTTGSTIGGTTSGVTSGTTGSTSGSGTGQTGTTGSTGSTGAPTGQYVATIPAGSYTGTIVDPNAGTTPTWTSKDTCPTGTGTFSFTYAGVVNGAPSPITTTINFPDGEAIPANIYAGAGRLSDGAYSPFDMGLTILDSNHLNDGPGYFSTLDAPWYGGLFQVGNTYSSTNMIVDGLIAVYPYSATITLTKTN